MGLDMTKPVQPVHLKNEGVETALVAWHFVGATLRDGRPVPPDGEWIDYIGRWDGEKQRHITEEIAPRQSGLHASERIIDALYYASGSTICRVELRGDLRREDDKLAGRERRILWRVDGEKLLREFARKCALDVIHLWDAPEIVRRYLETGDESTRSAAWDAAWASPWAAARAAAWSGARAAEQAAALAAARAAEAAAGSAAGSAAGAAARKAQNALLTAMVKAAHQKEAA